MLLSEHLTEIGRTSNKKNNLSMNEAKHKMNDACRMAVKNGDTPVRVKNSFCTAVDTLNKEGYPYFKHEHFNL